MRKLFIKCYFHSNLPSATCVATNKSTINGDFKYSIYVEIPDHVNPIGLSYLQLNVYKVRM